MKKRIFQLIDTFLAGLIFFLISYGFFEYTMNSGNGALITGFSTTLLFCIAYYALRQQQRQKTEEKQAAKDALRTLALQFQWMTPQQFQAFLMKLLQKEYPYLGSKNGYPLFTVQQRTVTFLFCNTPTGPQTQEMLAWVKCAAVSHCAFVLITVKPPEKDCQNLLDLLKTEVRCLGTAEIYALMEKHNISLPENSLLKKPQHQPLRARFKAFSESRYATGFAFKYGILLLIWSLLAHYKIYYLCSGLLLLALGIYTYIRRRKLQSKNIF